MFFVSIGSNDFIHYYVQCVKRPDALPPIGVQSLGSSATPGWPQIGSYTKVFVAEALGSIP
jgi:hypothetical protein